MKRGYDSDFVNDDDSGNRFIDLSKESGLSSDSSDNEEGGNDEGGNKFARLMESASFFEPSAFVIEDHVNAADELGNGPDLLTPDQEEEDLSNQLEMTTGQYYGMYQHRVFKKSDKVSIENAAAIAALSLNIKEYLSKRNRHLDTNIFNYGKPKYKVTTAAEFKSVATRLLDMVNAEMMRLEEVVPSEAVELFNAAKARDSTAVEAIYKKRFGKGFFYQFGYDALVVLIQSGVPKDSDADGTAQFLKVLHLLLKMGSRPAFVDQPALVDQPHVDDEIDYEEHHVLNDVGFVWACKGWNVNNMMDVMTSLGNYYPRDRMGHAIDDLVVPIERIEQLLEVYVDSHLNGVISRKLCDFLLNERAVIVHQRERLAERLMHSLKTPVYWRSYGEDESKAAPYYSNMLSIIDVLCPVRPKVRGSYGSRNETEERNEDKYATLKERVHLYSVEKLARQMARSHKNMDVNVAKNIFWRREQKRLCEDLKSDMNLARLKEMARFLGLKQVWGVDRRMEKHKYCELIATHLASVIRGKKEIK